MTDTPLMLAGDFATPTRQEWEAEVLKILNRRRPEGKELTIDQALSRLRTRTVDGLTIEPLYTDAVAPLGLPGAMPFTRGASVRESGFAWDMRALHEDGDAAFTNVEVLADLQRGATSIWLRTGGDAIAVENVAAALAGVNPALAPVAISSNTDQVAAAKALAAFWKSSGAVGAKGNLGLDAIALAARTGAKVDLAPHAVWVEAAMAELPGVRALTVDVLPYDDAGAGDVDQLAFAIATGVAYLRDLEAAGVSASAAFAQLEFRVSANADEFLTIARLRALRRLWARIGEVSGVPAEARGAIQHAVTSWRMITRDDPYVNLLRGMIATFAGAVGGAESITCLPFDTAVGLPDNFSRRLARNTQLVAAEESNIGRVSDPAGGSWYVESLTDQLATQAWTAFQAIEAAGGMTSALESGLIAERIATTTAERTTRLASRKQPITGVSMFPMKDEQPVTAKARPVTAAAGLTPVRDAEVFEAIRDRSAAATEKPKVFLACLGARRDFGGREMFSNNVLLVGGIDFPGSEGGSPEEIAAQAAASGAKMAILCSSAKIYAGQAIAVATALKGAGVDTVYIAGRKAETAAEDTSVLDGELFDGMDVVAFLEGALDRMGVAK